LLLRSEACPDLNGERDRQEFAGDGSYQTFNVGSAAKPVAPLHHLADQVVLADLVFELIVLVIGDHAGRHRNALRRGLR